MAVRSERNALPGSVLAPARRAKRSPLFGRVATVLIALGLLAGCTELLPRWGNRIEIEVSVTPPHAPLDSLATGHLVVMPSASSDEVYTQLRVGPGRSSLAVTIDKRTNLPILDYPLIAGRSDLLRPAGAVFPLDLDDRGRITTSYREGFLAELLLAVSSAGDLLEAVNVRRLRREIWERSGGDPWRLDRDAILQTLLFGEMRSDRIRPRPCFDLNIAAGAGLWVSGDPFYGPIVVDGENPLLALRGIPSGTHRFFRIGDATDRIDLETTEEGWVWMDAVTGCGGSGRW